MNEYTIISIPSREDAVFIQKYFFEENEYLDWEFNIESPSNVDFQIVVSPIRTMTYKKHCEVFYIKREAEAFFCRS